MQKLKFLDSVVLVVGLSSGDVVLVECKLGPEGQLKTRIIGTMKKVHDFGVNSLDAVTFKRSSEILAKAPVEQN